MSIRRATFEDVLDRCGRLSQQGQRLRPGEKPIVAFDADGTLWGPDVGDLLWDRLVEERALDRRGAAALARALRALGVEPSRDPYLDFQQLRDLRRRGRCPRETMVRAMLQGLAGLSEESVTLLCARAIQEARAAGSLGDDGARALLGTLRELEFRVVVVSGSPRWAVEVAAAPLDLTAADILAGQVAVVEGVLTDGILEPLPHGQGKVQALLRRFGAVPRVCLGNGLSDLAMMKAASDLRVLVNPSAELMTACEEIRGTTWTLHGLGLTAAPPRGRTAARKGPSAAARAAAAAQSSPARRRPTVT